MNRMKKIMAVLLAAVLVLSSMTVSAATSSPSKKSIAKANASAKTVTYNGKVQQAKMTVTIDGKTLVEGKDFKIMNNTKVNAGTYKLKIKGIGKYTGTQNVRYTIKKASQKVSPAGVDTTFKSSSLKKKAKTFTIQSTGVGKKTYTITSCPKEMKGKISVNSKGKVTLKKGIKKGSYVITLKCSGDSNTNSATKKIYIKVK